MTGAAKEKSLPASLAAARVLLLLVVALFLGENHVWGFAAPPQLASEQTSLASPSSVGEITTAWHYDASDSLLAAKGGGPFFHSTSPSAVQSILSNGFRADLPNVIAAGRNNRFGRGVYLSDSPLAALAERPGGSILNVEANLGRNLNINYLGPISDSQMAKAIARGARKHGYDSITTLSVREGGGVNSIIFDPARARATGVFGNGN